MTAIRDALQQGIKQLRPCSDTPQIDAEILLTFILQKTRVYLFTYPEHLLSEEDIQAYQALIKQRENGWPIAYLTKKRDFWDLKLHVSPATLIPRPETELLVESALTYLSSIPKATILELGTGSGAIALALASERPDCHITAVDISEEALEVAQQNAAHLQLNQVHFKQSDWFSAIEPGPHFHLIVSNPPYLAANDPHLLLGDLRFEPPQALISEKNGLAAIQHIIQTSLNYLLPAGWLCLEHGHTQREAVQNLFKKAGYEQIQTHLDIQGHGRMSVGQLPTSALLA